MISDELYTEDSLSAQNYAEFGTAWIFSAQLLLCFLKYHLNLSSVQFYMAFGLSNLPFSTALLCTDGGFPMRRAAVVS